MELNQYQIEAQKTAIYPLKGSNLVYPALKLAGEAGEVAEKVGKLMRDHGYVIGSARLDPNKAKELAKELGDVLWYCAAIADELGYTLNEIAGMNIEKLRSRQERGVIHGSGDNR